MVRNICRPNHDYSFFFVDPSISASIRLKILGVMSSLTTLSLLLAIASISSKEYYTRSTFPGLFESLCNVSLAFPVPWRKQVACLYVHEFGSNLPAILLIKRVLPHPGGPNSRIPLTGFNPYLETTSLWRMGHVIKKLFLLA